MPASGSYDMARVGHLFEDGANEQYHDKDKEKDKDNERSRSPRGGGDEYDDFDAVVAHAHSNSEERLPEDFKRPIRGVVSNCRSLILRRLKIRDRITKINNDIDALEKFSYPAGIKPFRPAFECPELGVPVTHMAPMQFHSFKVEAGTTYREAMTNLHIEYLIAQRKLEVRLCEKQIESILPEISFESFLGQCKRACPVVDNYESLGISLPPGLAPAFNIDKFATPLFMSMLRSVSLQQDKLKQKAEKDIERREKVLEEASRLDPRQVLENAVIQSVEKHYPKLKPQPKANGKGKGKEANITLDYVAGQVHGKFGAEDINMSSRRFSKKELDEWKKTKNGKSPEAARGQNAKQLNKSKGQDTSNKGNGKKNGTAKGKGKDGKGEQKGGKDGSKGKGKSGEKGKHSGKGKW